MTDRNPAAAEAWIERAKVIFAAARLSLIWSPQNYRRQLFMLSRRARSI